MRDFKDRVAVVTGAGSGIGRALAQALVARGAHVAISDVDEAALAATLASLAGASVKVTSEPVDVSQRAAVFAHAERVVADHGRVNLVFNNAGVALTGNIVDMKHEDLQWLMGINWWGVVHGTQAFLPHLIESGEGHIVNVSSVFGLIGVPGQSAYNAAKFAVRGYTEALRQELELAGEPVSASCVHPGGIATAIVRNARIPDPQPGDLSRDELAAQFQRAARTSPEKCAEGILQGVRKNKRRILVGSGARPIDWLQRLFPSGYQRLMIAASRRGQRPPP